MIYIYYLSRAEHVQFCLKMGGPSSKPKNFQMTDSELVPWGKGEKENVIIEKNLKPNAYIH